MKRCIILGSTGSIGTSSLDVVGANPEHFTVAGLAAGSSVDTMCEQVLAHKPKAVSMSDPGSAAEVRKRVGSHTKVYEGIEGMLEMIRDLDADDVINGLVGSVGVLPTLEALETGKDVLLANKETMVMAGHQVMTTARRTQQRIVPIDSEMSAIYQCISENDVDNVKKLILTASGGPFVDYPMGKLTGVTVEQALNHPTWAMGVKNTIDSASLMNKGLEVIEASFLFDAPASDIEVTIHRDSIVHSFVEFIDGSILAQISKPDMRLAIQYAMTDPGRLESPYGGLDFSSTFSLTFEPPDTERFPCLALAFEVLKRGGTAPAAMNGANERAVEAFVAGRISFMDIAEFIHRIVDDHTYIAEPTIEELVETDCEVKRAMSLLVESERSTLS